MTRPAMYAELAPWFHLLTPPADYADDAAFIIRVLADAGVALAPANPAATLLELGSGGGNTASHLAVHARLTLTDLAPEMLAISRRLNPGAEHLVGDMRTLRLGRTFDAVLIHDAVMYMVHEEDLAAALATAAAHARPGGAVVVLPDAVRETFQPSTDHGGTDGPDGRGLRYLEWSFDPDPADTTFVTDFAILLREADGTTRLVHDRHLEGLFPRATWLRLLEEAGFRAAVVADPHGRDVFSGVRR